MWECGIKHDVVDLISLKVNHWGESERVPH